MRLISILMVLSFTLPFGCTKPDKECLRAHDAKYKTEECVRQRDVEDKYGWVEYFWKVPLGTVGFILLVGIAANSSPSYNNTATLGPVTPNAYGPGVGMDATGKPVSLQGGVPGSYIQTPNAYGPGIHMDQFGNPVRY